MIEQENGGGGDLKYENFQYKWWTVSLWCLQTNVFVVYNITFVSSINA